MPKAATKNAVLASNLPKPLRKGEIRKREIIEATVACLATEGLAKTTFEAIGKRLGIGKSHVVYHFPVLAELVHHAVLFVYATGQEVVAEFIASEKKPEKHLDTYLAGTFHWMQHYPHHAAVAALLIYQATFSAEYAALQTEVRKIGLKRIEGMLGATKLGRKHSKAQLQAQAIGVQNLIMGQIIYFFAANENTSLKKVLSRLSTHCHNLLQ